MKRRCVGSGEDAFIEVVGEEAVALPLIVAHRVAHVPLYEAMIPDV
jgi:hypothetical protein